MNDSTDSLSRNSVGKITLSYHVNHESDPVVINIPDVDNSKFMNIAQTIAVEVESGRKMVLPKAAIKADSDKIPAKPYATIKKSPKDAEQRGFHDTPKAKSDDKEAFMNDFNRSELQAHLKSNKAEVDSVAASMKKDMAEWREQMRSDLRDVTEAINKQNSNLEKHFHAQDVKLSSSLELQTSRFEHSLTHAKLDIIKWALGLPALAFAVYKIYGLVTNTPTP